MRLELGKRADYAIRAAVDLARHSGSGQRRKARVLADEMDIPVGYVPQILADLVHADLVVSVAGRRGGYELARPPDEISLLAVIQAVDGDVASKTCVLRGGPCRWEGVCAVHLPWSRAQQAMLDQLQATSMAEVIEIDASLEAGNFQLPDDVAVPESGPAASR